MNDVSVRAATVDDVAAIQRVARQAWHATYGEFLATEAIDTILADWYAAEEIEAPITSERSVYLVAESEEIVGYASAAPIGAEDDDQEAQLYAIYVDPDRWGDGIGTTLLEAVVDRLAERDVERLRVEVLADNAVGVSFYESRGFERTAEREREIGDQTLSEYVYYRSVPL
ncbi:GNAT family N-acetyltransferase [Halococcus saccharolyticus]|uniref:GCN5-related N-acetyltransferase n=1 Tax=Halococcus saccharolyticus DSM 5350 TaxID=1227455 RepID=M0MDM1_9EURY|nr:GNAT family N-acetyltransferase [Halococcus saccharolyticus]EMA42485.1 GCN5-related N-acetyltransferase [Halococcus saccharolyticus DSM 5350]